MFDEGEPRMWKSILPMVIGLLCFWGAGMLWGISNFAWAAAGLGAWLLLIAWKQLWGYFGRVDAVNFEIRQRAMAITSEVMKLEAARNVHPRVFELLLAEKNKVWMRKSGLESPDGIPYSVLYAAPDVTEQFVIFFLQASDETRCMAKRRLVEGRKERFDPEGLTEEYVMYDRFILWLVGREIATKPFGDAQPPYWLPPWSPKLVAEIALGWEYPIEVVDEEDAEESAETLKDVIEKKKMAGLEQTQVMKVTNGNGKRRK